MNTSWITELTERNNDLSLNDIILPSTHNSHCTKVTTSRAISQNSPIPLLSKIPCISPCVSGWAINQTLNTLEQLKSGVRVIDIDASWDLQTNSWVCSHSYFISVLNEPLEQIKTFLDDYNDPVILNISPRVNVNNKLEDLAGIIRTLFNPYIFPPQNDFNFSIRDNMLVTNKKLIIIWNYRTNPDTQLYWSRAMYNGHWVQSNEIQPALDKIQIKLDEYPNKKTVSALNELSWVLTPETNNIVNGLLCCNYANLRCLMDDMNDYFEEFFVENCSKIVDKINNISFDFITVHIINLIISLNKTINR